MTTTVCQERYEDETRSGRAAAPGRGSGSSASWPRSSSARTRSIEQLLIALFAGGHCLITGAPGLAKTLLVRSIAQIFHLKFQRIQFTPDLMPADITGTEILEETERRPPADAVRQGADLRQRDPGRRNQPHAAQDAGRAARGDAGAPGDRGRACATRSRARSSCWPRRTRSRWKGPIRCPRRSSTGSCSTW